MFKLIARWLARSQKIHPDDRVKEGDEDFYGSTENPVLNLLMRHSNAHRPPEQRTPYKFEFKGINSKGKQVKGVIYAVSQRTDNGACDFDMDYDSEDEAVDQLKTSGMTNIQIRRVYSDGSGTWKCKL